MSLEIEHLVTDDVVHTPANETAMLLRRIKPVTAIITAILKTGRLLHWDDVLLLAAIKIILQHQVNVLRAREQEKKELIC